MKLNGINTLNASFMCDLIHWKVTYPCHKKAYETIIYYDCDWNHLKNSTFHSIVFIRNAINPKLEGLKYDSI